MNIKSLFLFIFLGILLFSCKKESNIEEGNLIKRRINVSTHQRETVDSFMYDVQNRLTGIKYFNTNTKYDIRVEYDGQGRFAKVRYSYLGREDYTCAFEFNSSGQIIKKIATPSAGFNFAYNESYAYDNFGRVISDTTYYKQTDTVLYYMTFRYNSNGNVVEDEFRNFGDTLNQGKTQYTYDNNPNPFYLQGAQYFFLEGNPNYLNKNNALTIIPWWAFPISNEFNYQLNGMPKGFITTDPNSLFGTYRSVFEIEYE